MKKLVVGVFAIVFCVSLIGCGSESKKVDSGAQNNLSKESVNTQVIEKKEDKLDTRNNVKRVVDYFEVAAKTSRFVRNHSFIDIMGEYQNLYKKDVVNPFSKIDSFTYDNNILTVSEEKDAIIDSKIQTKIIMIDTSTIKLKKQKAEQFIYGCNANNKGKVVTFIFVDGVYVYEIDENSAKKNDLTFFFPPIEDFKP